LRASAFGAFSLVSGVVLLVASVLAGALWERVDPAATFVAGGIVSLVALCALPFVARPRPAAVRD
jgi:hypothetical protein